MIGVGSLPPDYNSDTDYTYPDQWENYFARFPGVAETSSTTSNGAAGSTSLAAFPFANHSSPNGLLQGSQAHARDELSMRAHHANTPGRGGDGRGGGGGRGGNRYSYSAARDGRRDSLG